MPTDMSGDINGGALVAYTAESDKAVVYPLRHGVKRPISRLSISWSRGNTLRVSVLGKPSASEDPADGVGGKVVEVNLGNENGGIGDAKWRSIAYGSVPPFALLQSRKNSMSALSKMSIDSSPYNVEW